MIQAHRSKPNKKIFQYVAAFAAVYLVWGSTYLAIKVVVASIPPLLAAGVRFAIAGLLLYGWALFRGSATPSRREWRNVIIVSALMFFTCYACLFWAEKTMPSGLASVLVATLPLWTLILEAAVLRTQRLTGLLWLGLVLGFVAVLIISRGTGGTRSVQLWPTVAVIGSEVSWAVGSILSKRLSLPEVQSVSAGAQMLCGGVMLLIASLAFQEWHAVVMPSPAALFGLVYLIVAGSLAAFSAYVWLLKRMGPTRVSSYAYVNPVVALTLGYFFGGERFGASAMAGSALVLGSVFLILRKAERSPSKHGTSGFASERRAAPESVTY